MSETIDSFVSKLKKNGVDVGKQQAEKLVLEAEAKAAELIRKAQNESEKIVAEAKKEAERLERLQRHELELAARDSLQLLRENIGYTIQQVLKFEVAEVLEDRPFLVELIKELVLEYAKNNAGNGGKIRIRAEQETAKQLEELALKKLNAELNVRNTQYEVSLKDNLKTLGFEYRVEEETVEVTEESVSEFLFKMVSPAIRENLKKVVNNMGKEEQEA